MDRPSSGVCPTAIPPSCLVDTGADNFLLTPAAVKRFNLDAHEQVSDHEGCGRPCADASHYGEHIEARRCRRVPDGLCRSRSAASHWAGDALSGLFGADFLSGYDVLSDLPKRQITLFRLKGCSTASLHWQEPVERLPFAESSPVRDALPARLNGKSIDLMLDSGSKRTTILMEQTRKAGVKRHALEQDEILKAPESMVRIWMYGGTGSTVWRSGRISTAMKSLSSRRCRDPERRSVRIFCGGCRCGSRIVSGRLCCSGVTHQ